MKYSKDWSRMIDAQHARLQSRLLIVTLICLGAFLASCIFANWCMSICALIFFISYFIFLCIEMPKFVLKYLIFVFAAVTNIFGCAIAEFSTIYLYELRVSAKFVGSLPLLVLSRWLFFVLLLFFDKKWEAKGKVLSSGLSPSLKTIRALNATAVLFVFTLLVAFIQTVTMPSSLSLGVDRFSYSQLYGSGIYLGLITSYMPYLISIPMLACRYGNFLLGGLSILLYSVTLLWTGTKFGNLFALLCVGVWVFFDKISALENKKLRRPFLGILGTLTILIGFAVGVSAMNSQTFNASGYVAQRGAQQGQLWWRTYDLTRGRTHVNEFVNEINAVVSGENSASQKIGANYGLYKIMYLTAPREIVDYKLAQKSSYTEAGYAAMFYYFGVLGPLAFSGVMAFSIGLVVNSLLKASAKARFVDVFLLVRLTVVLRGTQGMFFWDFLDLASLLTYCYFVLRYIVDQSFLYAHRARKQQIGMGHSW